jgi:hypothetical protein
LNAPAGATFAVRLAAMTMNFFADAIAARRDRAAALRLLSDYFRRNRDRRLGGLHASTSMPSAVVAELDALKPTT